MNHKTVTGKLLVPGIALILTLAVSWWMYRSRGSAPYLLIPAADRLMAPQIRAVSIKGSMISFPPGKSSVILLEFATSGCSLCMSELPQLKILQARYAANELEIVIVALDYSAAKAGVTQQWETSGVTVIPGGGEIASRFGNVSNLPTRFLLDRRGAIASIMTGRIVLDKYDNTIKNLISEKS